MKRRRPDFSDEKSVVDGVERFAKVQTQHSGPRRRFLFIEPVRDVGREREESGDS